MAIVGDQFALFEAITALAMLVRRFDFRIDPDAAPVGMTSGATIHTSGGLHMFLTPRTHQVDPPPPPFSPHPLDKCGPNAFTLQLTST